MDNNHAENEKFAVEKLRQTEVQDIWKVTNKETGEVSYEKSSRSWEYTAADVLENFVTDEDDDYGYAEQKNFD